ncbi:MAG: rubrerythrin [Anaerolineaceae bacterium]|nr:MAG: rubrerythrin [Anaerolineaceae bacterium]
MSKTIDNLKTAFAGESQANRKYLAFAKKAAEDGFPQIAKLFRAAAHAETVHALNHFRAMDGVQSTAENLQAAISGENYEVVSMYPPMLAEAETEGNQRAARSFGWALEVEKIHEALYRQAAEVFGQGKDLPEGDYYVCPVCGYTHEGKMTDNCPVCGVPAEKFEKVA